MTPKIPKPKKPKTPVRADVAKDEQEDLARGIRARGRESLISAGQLRRKAKTLKSSLLGGY